MLEFHCQAVGRTKTDILRQLIMSLGTTATNISNDNTGYIMSRLWEQFPVNYSTLLCFPIHKIF
ncbi:hypothetical protein CEN45_05035 [Fischerella thermalis CCMEE 5198]|jgi:hypothetical protein|nr:hypothetical protein CI594_14780 [Fischerella thermalis CCMEE 5196]PMB25889.1 hypothetical protein CEN45_05035 [Fischerella thermalis CCMEE 5198]